MPYMASILLHILLAAITADVEVSPNRVSAKAEFENTIQSLRHSSIQIRNFLEQSDRLAWQELPFAQPIALPQVPIDALPQSDLLRFYLAQRLVQARLFDEAKQVLDTITTKNNIDQATILITKAVVFHHFSQREEGSAALRGFNEIAEREPVSRRHTELAKLLQFEWDRQEKEEETESIARQMDDVRRRLGQGRTDEDTQNAEEDVIQSLENLIERLGEQAQARRIQREARGQQPGEPPEENTQRAEIRGPGSVERREFFIGDSWGELPPRDREDALLRIEREFPPHYRDIIEQYFREMAK